MNRCLLSGISEDVRRYEEELTRITADHRHRENMLRRQMEARDHDHAAQVDSLKHDVRAVAIACGSCASNDDARE